MVSRPSTYALLISTVPVTSCMFNGRLSQHTARRDRNCFLEGLLQRLCKPQANAPPSASLLLLSATRSGLLAREYATMQGAWVHPAHMRPACETNVPQSRNRWDHGCGSHCCCCTGCLHSHGGVALPQVMSWLSLLRLLQTLHKVPPKKKRKTAHHHSC